MVNTLYTRMLAIQCLLLVGGGTLFWLFDIKLGWPDPLSVGLACFLMLVAGAVVVGIVLHPVDQLHSALRHVANGESVPLPSARSEDMRRLIDSLTKLQGLLMAQADAAEVMGVLNSLSEGVLVLNRERRVAMANASLRTMALEEPELGEGLAPDDPNRFQQVFKARCFVPDQLALIEDEMWKAPDRPRTDLIQLERPRQFLKRYSAPLANNQGAHTGFLVSFTDITQEVMMDRLRQEFIANASHELRTPVTSVKVLLENLVDGAKDDPAVRDEFIGDAAREIDRMHDLVNDLLDLAALESGRNHLQLVTFELQKVVTDAIATVIPQAKQRGVAIEQELPDGGLSLEADLARVRQVLVNLVTNAVKFTPAGGHVRVRIWSEAGTVRMSVADSGIGIPAQDLPHIFDRFFRVTRGRSRLQGGSGLGLTIVKQAIDAHRGLIAVESTEGQGTSFFITLPVQQTEAREA